jgi:serine/threonine-protein kinase
VPVGLSEMSEIRERARRLVGRTLGSKWRVERLVGVGGMSAVYEASHHRNGFRAALKVLHPEIALRANVRKRFLREGYIANLIDHPGVVRVIDDHQEPDGPLFLVMDLLVGETVYARWRRLERRMAMDDLFEIADRVLDVLVVAHKKGIAHRDLKPENIFVCCSGETKVLDFGIASMRELTSKAHVTQSGVSIGTPAFMAREQARGLRDEVDGQTDLWALGAMLFTLLSGRYVFDGRSVNEMLVAAATQDPPPLRTVAPEVPAALADFVDRALKVSKAERWESARAMQDALRRLMHGRSEHRLEVPVPHASITPASASSAASTTDEDEWFHTTRGTSLVRANRPAPILRRVGRYRLVGLAATIALGAGMWLTVDRSDDHRRSVAEARAAPPSTPMPTNVPPPAAAQAIERPTPLPGPEAVASSDDISVDGMQSRQQRPSAAALPRPSAVRPSKKTIAPATAGSIQADSIDRHTPAAPSWDDPLDEWK